MSDDRSRGSGPEKVTELVTPDLESPADSQKNEPAGGVEPDPAGGGCMKYGWGCLPVVAIVLMLPAGLVL